MIVGSQAASSETAIKPLRVAYLTEWAPYEETGVLRKLIGQVQTWRDLGVVAEIFCLAPTRRAPTALGFASYGSVQGLIKQDMLDRLPAARLGYLNKILSAPILAREIRRFKPDIVYYRQNGPWYPGLERLLAIAPTVVEINTDEEVEHYLWGAAFNALYRATQDRILNVVAGFVSVTREIARKYERFGRPNYVVANGFWGERVIQRAPENDAPAFVFVGSRLTGGASWHGVDKVLPLARAMPRCVFHIVGHTVEDFVGEPIPTNVVFHGFKNGCELAAIFARSDIGIGTLALHRKGMQEACPLKVRDYLMHGLPSVIGYEETEEALNSASYVLRINNAEDNVLSNIRCIEQFAWKWHGRRITDDLSFMSRRVKETQRLKFFAAVQSARG